MSQLKKCSGKECVKILCNKLGFSIVRQKGSHIVLKKETPQGAVGAVVPNHKEIKTGTLKGVLKLGKIEEGDLQNISKKFYFLKNKLLLNMHVY